MREKFDRNKEHINIGEIGGFENETEEERLKRIEETRMRIMALPIDDEIKMGMLNIFDNSIGIDEVKEKSK